MKAFILNCDFDRNTETNGAQLIQLYLKGYGVTDITILNVFENQFPSQEELQHCSCIIITGSRASVYEKIEWIKKLEELIIEIDKLHIPTLGICFGYQIVTQALGGKVDDSGTFNEGFESVELTLEGISNALFVGFPPQFKVYHSHGDIATRIPEDSRILAKCGNNFEAYTIRNFSCLQFHPEILLETAIRMTVRDRKDLNKVLNSDSYIVTPNIFRNFIKYCNINK